MTKISARLQSIVSQCATKLRIRNCNSQFKLFYIDYCCNDTIQEVCLNHFFFKSLFHQHFFNAHASAVQI